MKNVLESPGFNEVVIKASKQSFIGTFVKMGIVPNNKDEGGGNITELDRQVNFKNPSVPGKNNDNGMLSVLNPRKQATKSFFNFDKAEKKGDTNLVQFEEDINKKGGIFGSNRSIN